MKCYDCPRGCGADRDVGIGFCGGGAKARIAKVIDDFEYEEPCLGTVAALFFGGCALGCSYCQNYKISRGARGREYSDGELASLFDKQKHPLDLVTPSHYLSAIERAVGSRKKANRIIYNTSGYETTEAVKRASAFTDVFLADYKYSDGSVAAKFSRAPDYPEIALAAIEIMRETKDEWQVEGGRKILKRGLIIRHLVLPSCVKNSIEALDGIARTIGTDVVLSLMSQFTPNGVGEPTERLRKIEYKIVVEHAIKLGFGTGYIQDFSSATEAYTPKFE